MVSNVSSANSSDKCKAMWVGLKDDPQNILVMCREHGIEPIFTNDIRKALPAVSKQESKVYNAFILLVEKSGEFQMTVYVRIPSLMAE